MYHHLRKHIKLALNFEASTGKRRLNPGSNRGETSNLVEFAGIPK